jgi:outer membrane murein-binding lipoprotein Lpp
MRRHIATVLAAVIAASATSYGLAEANRPEAAASAASTTKVYQSVRALRSQVKAVDSRIRALEDDVQATRDDVQATQDDVRNARAQLHGTCRLATDRAYACPSGVYP